MAHPTVLPPGALGKRGFSRILQDSSQSPACRMAGCAVAFPARALACSAPTTLLLRTTTEDLALPRSTLVRGPGEARVCRAVDHTLGARPKRKRADRGPARWRAALRWTPDGADIDTRPGLPLRHSVGVGRGDQAYPALLLVPLLIFRGAPARAVRGRAELAGGLVCGRTAGNRGVRRLAPRRPRSHE